MTGYVITVDGDYLPVPWSLRFWCWVTGQPTPKVRREYLSWLDDDGMLHYRPLIVQPRVTLAKTLTEAHNTHTHDS